MEQYNELIRQSLIDFEEIKFVLANNNIELVSSKAVKEIYFLQTEVSLKRANYKKIMENSYILTNINDNLYLSYKSEEYLKKQISKLKINDEKECVDFLMHAGYKEAFTIEKNIYEYKSNSTILEIVNLIGIGLYLCVKKEDASEAELLEILSSFNIPYNEKDTGIIFEKLVVNKLRRYMK